MPPPPLSTSPVSAIEWLTEEAEQEERLFDAKRPTRWAADAQEELLAEELQAEELPPEEPLAQEALAAEHLWQEPPAEGLLPEEPPAEELLPEELLPEESPAEELLPEESPAEELLPEESQAEELLPEELLPEEPLAAEHLWQEPLPEEPLPEEPLQQEPVPAPPETELARSFPSSLRPSRRDPALDVERAIRRAVTRALAEDLGESGDATTLATVPVSARGRADVVARQSGVLAGMAVVREAFSQVDPRVLVDTLLADGDQVGGGEVVARVRGPLRSILTAERTAMNFLCHLSGIATETARFVDAVAGTGCVVRDTRKTTPGLRLLEKAAVVAGGGQNHRIGLFDALLVKDNHEAVAGGVLAAAQAALAQRGGRPVQVEVTDLQDLEPLLEAGITDILLDNMTVEKVRRAVEIVRDRATLEASGTITLANVRGYAGTGVNRVAVGALTHSAPWLDLALDIGQTDDLVG